MKIPITWSNSQTSDKPKHTTVVYFHGMGSQRRYEELGRLIDALDQFSHANSAEFGLLTRIRASLETPLSKLPRQIGCVELLRNPPQDSDRTDGKRKVYKFYEAYWAHVTAGGVPHAAQSLISYIGNATFKASWAAWYALRPWIGAVLGLAIYFAFRAGLVAGASAVNPYGVVALGLLGGWFSKTTTDKLQEVFETLFKTDEDKDRKDKLRAIERPVIDSINPSPVPATTNDIFIVGQNFIEGAKVIVNGSELDAEFISETVLKTAVVQRPAAGTTVTIKVKNPRGLEALSNDVTTIFE